jgi:fucose permease
MIALPIYFQMVFEHTAMETGLAIAPMSLSMFAVALIAGRKLGNRRPSRLIQAGFGILLVGVALLIPLVPRADSGWSFLIPLAIVGTGLGLLVSQLNNYTLSPISEERVSEAAGVNSAGGSFGLSFGLAFAGAMMLAALSFSFLNMATSSTVLSTEQQEQVAVALEEDAQIMSDTQLEAQLAGQPPEVQEEILRINAESRYLALQVALMIPLLAALIGFINSFRMVKLPDLEPSSAVEGVLGG